MNRDRTIDREAELYYGFASGTRPEREYDHDDDPDFGSRAERRKSRERMAAMDTGDGRTAAEGEAGAAEAPGFIRELHT